MGNAEAKAAAEAQFCARLAELSVILLESYEVARLGISTGLTARARPEARPETRAANLRG